MADVQGHYEKHFLFAEQSPVRRRLPATASDSILLESLRGFFGGFGTYSFDGVNYTEHIKVFTNPNFVGRSIPFCCEFINDLWIQRGIFPASLLGNGEEDYEITEVWKRIE